MKEYIPGGYAKRLRPSKVDPCQLRAGVVVELEHTRFRRIAKEIALVHLGEDAKYYSKLCRVWPTENGCKVLRQCLRRRQRR